MRTIHRNNYDPQLGDYHERIVIDDAREKRWLFDCDGVYNDITEVKVADELGDSPNHAISQRAATEAVNGLVHDLEIETDARIAADEELGEAIDEEALARAEADAAIEQEIQDIKDNPDVVDIVATYADLQNYDTSALGDKDVIRVLADETHQGESSYYRWSTDTSTWTFIGATGPYYTKAEVDALIAGTKAKLVYVQVDYDQGKNEYKKFYLDKTTQAPITSDDLAGLLSSEKTVVFCANSNDSIGNSMVYFYPTRYSFYDDGSTTFLEFINDSIYHYVELRNNGTVIDKSFPVDDVLQLYIQSFDNDADQDVYLDDGLTRQASGIDVMRAMRAGKTIILKSQYDTGSRLCVSIAEDAFYDYNDAVVSLTFRYTGTAAELGTDTVTKCYEVASTSYILSAPLRAIYKEEDNIRVVRDTDYDFSSDLSVFANRHRAGIYRLMNTSNSDIALLPKGIEGDNNYQLSLRKKSSIYAIVIKADGLGNKAFLIGAVRGNYSKVALIEPDASAKIKLWTQVADNLTTTSNDGQKVLSAYQGKVLADRIGNLSALLTTDKTSAVAAINELVGSGGAATINSQDWSSLWQ